MRARRGESDEPGREIFSRCAKALIRVGNPAEGTRGFERVVGLRLELVPEADPVSLRDGGLPVRLYFEGKPLASVLVVATSRAAPAETHERRTDRQGLVQLPLERRGEWLVSAVHMVPAAAGTGADWESLWASLTLER